MKHDNVKIILFEKYFLKNIFFFLNLDYINKCYLIALI